MVENIATQFIPFISIAGSTEITIGDEYHRIVPNQYYNDLRRTSFDLTVL